MDTIVAAIDVGNPRNTGWNRIVLGPEHSLVDQGSGSSLTQLVELLAEDLHSRRRVALGFEAPLFLPLPDDAKDLCKNARAKAIGHGQLERAPM